MQDIEISVVIPCFNAGEYLHSAIGSIHMEADIARHLEIIVVDDGSNDEHTLDILQNLPKYCQVLRKSNGGPASARNYGIRQAKGKYIFTLDSDNLIEMEYLYQAKQILDTCPQVGVVYAKPILFGSEACKHLEWHAGKPHSLLELVKQNYIDTCAMFRKEVWQHVGGFDENRAVIGHEDWLFWLQIALKTSYTFYFIDKPLFYYRVKESNSVTLQYNQYGAYLTQKLTYLYPIRRALLKKLLYSKQITHTQYKQTLGHMSGYLAMMHIHSGSLMQALRLLLNTCLLRQHKAFVFFTGALYWAKARLKQKVYEKTA